MTRYTYTLPLLFIIAIFIADLTLPQDIEVHVFYLAAVVLAMKINKHSVIILVFLCSILTLSVMYLMHATYVSEIINRFFTILALAAVGWLGEQITKALHVSKEDQLTKLYNRRGVEVEKQSRETKPTAAILIDLDNFKRVNDTWGLLSGDLVLKEVADMLTTVARSTDVVGRWGGDEFIVLIWDIKWHDAQKIADRFYRMLSNARVDVNADGAYTRVSASLGVVQLSDDSALHDVVKRAQTALKNSKVSGKNCITYIDDKGAVAQDITEYQRPIPKLR